MELLLQTGMMVRELCALCVEDSDPVTGQLAVGAGRRRRFLKLGLDNPCLLRHLERAAERSPDEPLLASRDGGPLSPRDVSRLVKRRADGLGLPPGTVTPRTIIAASRMLWLNLAPEAAKHALGYRQPRVALHKYEVPGLADRPPDAVELCDLLGVPVEGLPNDLRPDSQEPTVSGSRRSHSPSERWLKDALALPIPSPRHGFPPPAPVATFHDPLMRRGDAETLGMRLRKIGKALSDLVVTLERRQRNRGPGRPPPDPARILALREAILAADPNLAIIARILGYDTALARRSEGFTAMVQRSMDRGASEEEIFRRTREELARREAAWKEYRDASVEAREPGAITDWIPKTGVLIDFAFQTPNEALDALERMLDSGRGWEAFAWICDQCWAAMRWMCRCGLKYYGLPRRREGRTQIIGPLQVRRSTPQPHHPLPGTSPRGAAGSGAEQSPWCAPTTRGCGGDPDAAPVPGGP